MNDKTADVIVVGGGPAGLNCALVLGRSGRKVTVFDTGHPRNEVSGAMGGFISRDGEHPAVFLQKARKELLKYKVTLVRLEVKSVRKVGNLFKTTGRNKETYFSKKVLLATGLKDVLPDLPDIDQYYGKSVFHCPYCDGWEMRDRSWLVFAPGRATAIEVALRLRTWTKNLTLLAAHTRRLTKNDGDMLVRNGVKICHEKVMRLEGRNGMLKHVVLMSGQKLPAGALFFNVGKTQQCNLAEKLNCRRNNKGLIISNQLQETNVAGLYVAGDMAWDMQLVIIAAAEGARAAVAINTALNKEMRVK